MFFSGDSHSTRQENPCLFVEAKVLLLCSQEPANTACPESHEFCLQPPTLFP